MPPPPHPVTAFSAEQNPGVPPAIAPSRNAKAWPGAPSTPCTRTAWPVTGPSPKTARCAVIPRMPRQAARSSLTPVRQVHGLPVRHDGELRRGPGRPVGLRAVDLDAAADPGRVHVPADRLDHPRPFAVRDHPRERYRGPKPAAALLGIPGFTPDRVRRTRTSPGPGSGAGSSPACSTCAAGLCRSYQTARTGHSSMLASIRDDLDQGPGQPGCFSGSVRRHRAHRHGQARAGRHARR
jgi:hypothetical protein